MSWLKRALPLPQNRAGERAFMPRRLESRTTTQTPFPGFFFSNQNKTAHRALLHERSLYNNVTQRSSETNKTPPCWCSRRVSSVPCRKTVARAISAPRFVQRERASEPTPLSALLGTASYARAAEYVNELLHIHDFSTWPFSWAQWFPNILGEAKIKFVAQKPSVQIKNNNNFKKQYIIYFFILMFLFYGATERCISEHFHSQNNLGLIR